MMVHTVEIDLGHGRISPLKQEKLQSRLMALSSSAPAIPSSW